MAGAGSCIDGVVWNARTELAKNGETDAAVRVCKVDFRNLRRCICLPQKKDWSQVRAWVKKELSAMCAPDAFADVGTEKHGSKDPPLQASRRAAVVDSSVTE